MKRRHTLPRDFWKHPVRGGFFEQLKDLSPRQRYIAEQSVRRYERRNPGETVKLMAGEVGVWRGVKIIEAPGQPDPR